MAKGLVGGKILYSDSTHLKAAHGKKPLKFDGDEVKKQRAEEKEYYFDYDSQGGNASGGSDDVKTVKARTTDPAADLCTGRVRILTREESKRRNAALPIPKNYTASVIAVCGGFPRLPSSASSLPACRI